MGPIICTEHNFYTELFSFHCILRFLCLFELHRAASLGKTCQTETVEFLYYCNLKMGGEGRMGEENGLY